MQWMGGVCKRHKPWPGIERRFVADAWNKGSRERVQREEEEKRTSSTRAKDWNGNKPWPGRTHKMESNRHGPGLRT